MEIQSDLSIFDMDLKSRNKIKESFVPGNNVSNKALGSSFSNKFLFHQMKGVQCVNGKLHKHRT